MRHNVRAEVHCEQCRWASVPSQVFCNGEEVLTVSGTKEKYVVDVWSGNHPFFKASPVPSACSAHSRCPAAASGPVLDQTQWNSLE